MIVLNEAKIKYSLLDEMLEDYLSDIKFSSNTNIIIDLKEIIRKLFRPEILQISKNNRPRLIEELSSDIISIVSHYRNYFYKKGKYTTFYFLYSEKESELMKSLLPEYKTEYYEKYFRDPVEEEKIKLIKKVIDTVKAVFAVVPHVYYIETSEFDEAVFAKAIFNKIPKNELSLILSNNNQMFQFLDENILGINLKGIKSSLLTVTNAFAVLSKRETNMSAKMIPLVMAIGGDKKNSFPNIPGFAFLKAMTTVENLLKNEIITDNESVLFPLDSERLDSTNKLHNQLLLNINLIERNYEVITGLKTLYTNSVRINEALVIPKRRASKQNFLDLNAKIFTNFPIMLDMLLKGEKLQ